MFGIRKLKRKISELEISRNEWMKIEKTGLEEIKTLKNENAKLISAVENKDNTIKTLQSEVERLTRKRDAYGRFVKTAPIKHGFEVGDKVRIKDGISSETHHLINPGFVSGMDKYIGKTEVIKRLSDKGYVYLSDNIPTPAFHPDWLEHAE